MWPAVAELIQEWRTLLVQAGNNQTSTRQSVMLISNIARANTNPTTATKNSMVLSLTPLQGLSITPTVSLIGLKYNIIVFIFNFMCYFSINFLIYIGSENLFGGDQNHFM